jgi:hypothetical protein
MSLWHNGHLRYYLLCTKHFNWVVCYSKKSISTASWHFSHILKSAFFSHYSILC